MSELFYDMATFNDDISTWDTSQVTDMYYMFAYASAFNQAVGSWDTSKVTSMAYMFWGASAFNQDLCQWRSAFPYNNADDIFAFSGCAYQATPVSTNGGENWCSVTTCN
jgi:surface protein